MIHDCTIVIYNRFIQIARKLATIDRCPQRSDVVLCPYNHDTSRCDECWFNYADPVGLSKELGIISVSTDKLLNMQRDLDVTGNCPVKVTNPDSECPNRRGYPNTCKECFMQYVKGFGCWKLRPYEESIDYAAWCNVEWPEEEVVDNH